MITDWTFAKLGDFFKIKHGYAFKSKYFSNDGDYIVLTPGNFLPQGGLTLKGEKEKYYHGDFPQEYILSIGDLLIVMTDLTQNAPILGAPAFIKKNNKFLHNQRLGLVQDLDEEQLYKSYLFFLMNALEVRGQLKGSATGATVKHTAPERIYRVKVPIPPLPTQRKISAILSAYDDLIENNTRRIEILEEMAQRIYKEWFVDFRYPGHENDKLVKSELGMIPEGWEVVEVKRLLNRLKAGNKYTQKNVEIEGKVPVIDQSTKEVLGYHDNDPDHFARSTKPIIIFGDHTCKMQLMVEPFSVGPNVIPFTSKDYLPIHFLFYLVNSLVETREYKRHWNDLIDKNVVCALIYIAEEYSETAFPIFEEINNLRKTNKNLRQTRDFLLPKLISGKVDVSELDIDMGAET